MILSNSFVFISTILNCITQIFFLTEEESYILLILENELSPEYNRQNRTETFKEQSSLFSQIKEPHFKGNYN